MTWFHKRRAIESMFSVGWVVAHGMTATHGSHMEMTWWGSNGDPMGINMVTLMNIKN
jgi:hypothetical protein